MPTVVKASTIIMSHDVDPNASKHNFVVNSKDNRCKQDASDAPNNLATGFNCDDKDQFSPIPSLDKIDTNVDFVVSSRDAGIIQEITHLLGDKVWDASTETIMTKQHGSHLSNVIIGDVINKQSRLPVVRKFFEWSGRHIVHDSYAYHALLLKLGQNREFDEMWEIINKMKEVGCQVSETTFCILIKAYGTASMPNMAFHAFNRMGDHGVMADIRVCTTLISVFFKLKLSEELHLFFTWMLMSEMKLDIKTFSALIQAFGALGSLMDAQALFRMMMTYGLEPDLSIFHSVIYVCCHHNAWKDATNALDALMEKGLKPGIGTCNLVLRTLCKSSKLEEATNLFTIMKGANIEYNQLTYNILLQGMLAREDYSSAISFFKQMVNEQFVDSKSCAFLSSGLQKANKIPELLDLFKGLFDSYGFSKVEVCDALIYSLSNVGQSDEATRLFRGMIAAQKHPSMSSYAIMIGQYCRLGKLEAAIELLTEVKGNNCAPSCLCYASIITALLRKGKAVDAYTYVQEMQGLGVEVPGDICDNLLRELCSQNMSKDAKEICNLMITKSYTVSPDTLFELMKCLVKLKATQEASSFFKQLYTQNLLLNCKAVSQAWAVMNLFDS
ncbi:hypothetical protein KP509_27G070600 [Ceratopteris richardii]|nr:hypothetical protein KP509_27G070600 [Ceratopteris richardii]